MKKQLFVLIALLVSAEISAQVKIIAHRGASYIAPENTVAASKLAWSLKADAVETDIYLTKDNKVICSHDGTTKRTTGQDLKISETPYSVLADLDAGSWKSAEYKGEKLPLLEDLIRVMPKGKELVVEIKCGPEVLPFLKKIIDKYKKNRSFTFIAFDLKTITETKKTFPPNPCYWLCSNKELLAQNFGAIAPANLEGLSLSWNIIDADVMKKAESMNLEVYTWTVDNPDEAKRLVSLGVKGITTNRPGWLEEQTGISKPVK